ncbi:hypothetical protein J6590_084756 [Homalodisca vitripennis]|nr:hypothetical protein J6590_084756 [Homalodisca vitripennis]
MVLLYKTKKARNESNNPPATILARLHLNYRNNLKFCKESKQRDSNFLRHNKFGSYCHRGGAVSILTEAVERGYREDTAAVKLLLFSTNSPNFRN